jgi:hypothetical protein
MELLLILLTGFFLWLWLYDGSRRSYALLRTEAGELIASAPRRGYEHRYFLAVLWIVMFLNFWMCQESSGEFSGFKYSLAMSAWFCVFLVNVFPPFFYSAAFEIHEKGLVAGGLFAPWSEVRYCEGFYIADLKGKIVFNFRGFSRKFHVVPNQKYEIIKILGRFIGVYDENGVCRTPPLEKKEAPEDDRPHPALRRTRFQFDLRSLLLFFIFASSLSSLGGIHYHRWEEKQKAVAALETFHPRIEWLSSEVWHLDFSRSAKKPSDDDLPLLLKFPRLSRLDLTGAPITDAGLAHLAALDHRVSINLTGTRVTAQGVKRLKESLPKSSTVLWLPPSPTCPSLSPSPSQNSIQPDQD